MQIEKENPLMWSRESLIIIIGLSSGFVVAGGLYSFITMIGVLTRLATRTKTANRVMLYEDMVTLGAGIGNWVYFWPFDVPFGRITLIVIGLFTGVFVGCLAIALAEVLNVIPTFARRVKLKKGLCAIICAMGAGKLIGTLFQLVWMKK